MVLVFGYSALIFWVIWFLVCHCFGFFFFGEFTAGAAGGILFSLFLSFLVSFGFLGEQDWRYAKLA
jgi:hypothetical protein